MKIGLLLGSFDPIHIAHINAASCVLNSGICDKVLFVVAKHNPWKKNEPTPFEIRCQMIEAAIEPLGDKCQVSRIEEELEPPTYSYITIGKALELYPNDELYLICGSDTVKKLDKWKNFDTHIKDKIKLIEVSREIESISTSQGIPFAKKATYYETWNKYETYYRIVPLSLDISSTIVRNMVEKGMNPTPYVPPKVLEIIKKYNLYTNGKTSV